MTTRYVARPRLMFDGGDDQWHRADVSATTVYERDDNSVKTGLIDVRGNPIMRITETEPIGFIPVKL